MFSNGKSKHVSAKIYTVKPQADNFMWTKGPDGHTVVRIVDFGCLASPSSVRSCRKRFVEITIKSP